MLVEFSIQNFRSIKDKVTIDLRAATSDKVSLPNNMIETKGLKQEQKLLKSEVIYGANASGKSNLLQGISHLLNLVKNSHNFQQDDDIPYQPFKLDVNCLLKPTEIQIVFIRDGIKYVYEVSHNKKEIIYEALFYYPNRRIATIFKRDREAENEYTFTIDKKDQRFISQKTPKNVLYLSRSAQLNYEKTADIINWFSSNIAVIGGVRNPQMEEYSINLLNKDEDCKNFILNALKVADLGIDDITAELVEFDENNVPKGIPSEIIDFLITGKAKAVTTDIKTYHNGVEFDFEEESDGTKRFFTLIGPILSAFKKERTLIIDELGVQLHQLLSEFIINLFHNPEQNKNNSQLIFSTHNTSLLDQNLFRRDQIWFTEKNPDTHGTEMFSLIEFRERKDRDIRKGYLTGRYGALPFINENGMVGCGFQKE